MATEEDAEISTPSATDTPALESEHHDPAQTDKETSRKSIRDHLDAAVEDSKREPSAARQAAAAQRARDNGKFAPGSKDRAATAPSSSDKVEAPADTAASPEAATQSPAAKPGEQQPAASTPAVAVPTSWPEEAKNQWASLPPAIQQAVAKREKEVSDGFAQYQNRTRDIDQAFAPYRTQLQQFGKTEGQAISQLLVWHAALADPQRQAEAFRALAKSHGFNLATLVPNQGQPQQQQQDPNDPQRLLAPYLTPLEQRLQAAEQREEQRQAREAAEQARSINSEIANFAKDKPDFDSVRQHIAEIIIGAAQTGRQMTLQQAYEEARWANASIRDQLLSDQAAKREAEAKAASEAAQAKAAADAEAKRKADAEAAVKARRANVSVRGSTPTATSRLAPRPNKSLRQGLAEAINAVQGRGSV